MKKVLFLLFTILIIITSCCQDKSIYDTISIDMVTNGSGIMLSDYSLIETFNDKDLQEDGWGQQVWLIKQKHPIKKDILDSLVANDNRWEFQDDVRQQYLFSEIKVNKHRTIYISDDDSIMSLSYDWKK